MIAILQGGLSTVTPELGSVATAGADQLDPQSTWIIVTAIATAIYASVSIALLIITHNGQKANFDRWLAANKPVVRMALALMRPDKACPHYSPQDMLRQFLVIENKGKLPCRLVGCWFGDINMKGRLINSNIEGYEASGVLESGILASGELHLYDSEAIKEATCQYANSADFILRMIYEYEPDIRATLTYRVRADGEGPPYLLFLHTDSRECHEERIQASQPGNPFAGKHD